MPPINLTGPSGPFSLGLATDSNKQINVGAAVLRVAAPDVSGFASMVGAVSALLVATAVAAAIASSAGAATVSSVASAGGSAIASASGAAVCQSASAGQSETLQGGVGSSASAASVAGAGAASALAVGVVSATSAALAVSNAVGVNVGLVAATSDASAVGAAIAAAQGAVEGQSAVAGAGLELTGSAGLVAVASAAVATGTATSAVAGAVAGQSGATAVGATAPSAEFTDDFGGYSSSQDIPAVSADWTYLAQRHGATMLSDGSGNAIFGAGLSDFSRVFVKQEQITVPNQFSELVIAQINGSGNKFIGPTCRMSGVADPLLFANCYWAELNTNLGLQIQRIETNGAQTALSARLPYSGNFTDTLRLQAENIGSDVLLTLLVNGVVQLTATDSSADKLLSGNPGVFIGNQTAGTTVAISIYSAGNL